MSAAESTNPGYRSVTVDRNVLMIAHGGDADASVARAVRTEVLAALGTVRDQYSQVALIYDASNLRSADEGYARGMGELGREIGDEDVLYVCLVTRGWIRVLARMAAIIGKIRIHFVKSWEDVEAHLIAYGFAPPDGGQPKVDSRR